MNSFEDDLATALRTHTPEPPRDIDAEDLLSAPPARAGRRRRAILAPVLAAVVVLGVAVGIVVAHRYGRQAPATAPRPSTGTVTPHPIAHPPAGFSANEFRMAAPILLSDHGGPPVDAPACEPGQVHAIAATRRSDGGVLGVVRLLGTAMVRDSFGRRSRCSLSIATGPVALLTADGRPLAVRRVTGDRVMTPSNQRSDIPLAAGNAAWGFGWYGSWCGPGAAAVEMRLRGGALVRAPLHGPQPTCAGRSSAVLVPGVAGGPSDPVQAARPDYAQLRLSARVEPGTTADRLAPIRLTLRTAGTTAVPLDPCPEYGGDFDARPARGRPGGFASGLRPGYLPCTARRVVVDPGRPLHVTVPATAFFETAGPGWVIAVRVAIAGVPVVQLTVRVR